MFGKFLTDFTLTMFGVILCIMAAYMIAGFSIYYVCISN